MTWATNELRRRLAELVDQGVAGQAVVDLLTEGPSCAPLEGDQLDYKLVCSGDDIGVAEVCRDIVALHNTYGGYLVFGVKEHDHERFEVVGVEGPIDVERFKNKLRDFTGVRIPIQVATTQGHDAHGTAVGLCVVFVPARLHGQPPLEFIKSGPGKPPKGRPVFEREDIVVREGDETRCARGAKLQEIWAPRRHPLLEPQGPSMRVPLSRIENNLPDRSIICPQVVGRKDALENLWRWLPDDLSHVRVLAGEGGIGKTSIAYEFADQLTLLEHQPFQQLIWLSAKQQQFRPFKNTYDEIVEIHFGSYEELLDCLCEKLGITQEERDGVTPQQRLRLIKQALTILPSFVVVDDVDSLTEAEQRQAVEIGLVLGGTTAKVLLTTRKNDSYSADVCYTVRGLDKQSEFPAFFETLSLRFPSATRPVLEPGEINRIWDASKGSPLFAESILRLLDYQGVSEAIESWKGKSGDEVRKAALHKEINQLLPEARRILLALALLSEASVAELTEVTGYSASQLATSIKSLTSLFLVEAPKLGSESRIRVSDTTSRLAISLRSELVTDHARLEKTIREFRRTDEEAAGKPGSKPVAYAILQAVAQERQGNVAKALETLQHAAKLVPARKRQDLLAYMGHLYLKHPKPDVNKARQVCREAYQGGCRKKRLYETWFSAEWEADNFPGTEEVCRHAVADGIEPEYEWRIRLAAALASKAHAQSGGRMNLSVIPTYLEASETLAQAVRRAPRDEAHKWRVSLEETNDMVYKAMLEHDSALSTAQQLLRFIQQGDIRLRNYTRAAELCTPGADQSRKHGGSESARTDTIQQLRELIEEREQRFPEDDRHPGLIARINALLGGDFVS